MYVATFVIKITTIMFGHLGFHLVFVRFGNQLFHNYPPLRVVKEQEVFFFFFFFFYINDSRRSKTQFLNVLELG